MTKPKPKKKGIYRIYQEPEGLLLQFTKVARAGTIDDLSGQAKLFLDDIRDTLLSDDILEVWGVIEEQPCLVGEVYVGARSRLYLSQRKALPVLPGELSWDRLAALVELLASALRRLGWKEPAR